MKIAIIGHTGFIGSYLYKKLKKNIKLKAIVLEILIFNRNTKNI